MNYEVTKNCMIQGKQYKAGDTVVLDTDVARNMMAIGRVVPKAEPMIENRAVGLEESDEKPKKRGRPKKAVEEQPEAEEE